MWPYLTRKNLILAAVTALILFYLSTEAFWGYLGLLLLVVVVFHLGSAHSAAKVANFIANTATVVFTVLFLVVLLEIGMHLTPHFFLRTQNPDTLGKFSDYTSRGYLTEKVFQKPKGAFRILALGDSFSVYATDKKKNYLDLLRGRYADLSRGRVELVNAGMPAIGPGYYWQILKNYGDRFKPDLVLVGFFVGNDFLEGEMFNTIGSFIFEPHDLKQKLWDYHKFANSRTSKLFRSQYIWYHEQLLHAKEAQAQGGHDSGTFSQESFLEIERNRAEIFLNDKKRRAVLAQKWQQCVEPISQMKQWCEARKVPLVLLILPDQFQVDADLRTEVLKKYHLTPESLDLEFPDALVSSYCRQNRIHCLDLLPPFQEKGKTATLYVLRDTHWNDTGNRLAAETVFKYLQEQNLVKTE